MNSPLKKYFNNEQSPLKKYFNNEQFIKKVLDDEQSPLKKNLSLTSACCLFPILRLLVNTFLL